MMWCNWRAIKNVTRNELTSSVSLSYMAGIANNYEHFIPSHSLTSMVAVFATAAVVSHYLWFLILNERSERPWTRRAQVCIYFTLIKIFMRMYAIFSFINESYKIVSRNNLFISKIQSQIFSCQTMSWHFLSLPFVHTNKLRK